MLPARQVDPVAATPRLEGAALGAGTVPAAPDSALVPDTVPAAEDTVLAPEDTIPAARDTAAEEPDTVPVEDTVMAVAVACQEALADTDFAFGRRRRRPKWRPAKLPTESSNSS